MPVHTVRTTVRHNSTIGLRDTLKP